MQEKESTFKEMNDTMSLVVLKQKLTDAIKMIDNILEDKNE